MQVVDLLIIMQNFLPNLVDLQLYSDKKSKLHKEITLKLITDHNIPNKSSMSGDDM